MTVRFDGLAQNVSKTARDQSSQLRTQLQDLRKQFESAQTLQQQLSDLSAAKARLEERCATQNNKNINLENALKAAEANSTTLEATVSRLEIEIARVSSLSSSSSQEGLEQAELEMENTKLRQQLEKTASNLTEANEKLRHAVDAEASLNEQVSNLKVRSVLRMNLESTHTCTDHFELGATRDG